MSKNGIPVDRKSDLKKPPEVFETQVPAPSGESRFIYIYIYKRVYICMYIHIYIYIHRWIYVFVSAPSNIDPFICRVVSVARIRLRLYTVGKGGKEKLHP